MMRVFKLMTNGNFEDLTMFDYKSSDKDKDSYKDFSDFIMQEVGKYVKDNRDFFVINEQERPVRSREEAC